ncbi:MAG: hypothetical protein V3V15_08760 [Sphingorhabdus sp.]
MADESDIALGVMLVANSQSNGIATFHRSKKEIPALVNLDNQNLSQSLTRPSEPMWHQLLRNIKSHYQADGNYIQIGYLIHVPRRGYQITKAGKAKLKALGY